MIIMIVAVVVGFFVVGCFFFCFFFERGRTALDSVVTKTPLVREALTL